MDQDNNTQLEDLQWTIAIARLIFGPSMNIQAPPNLSADNYWHLVAAGINDWGGISPVTPDHVNPEAPWPTVVELTSKVRLAGKTLVPRLPIYPEYMQHIPEGSNIKAIATYNNTNDFNMEWGDLTTDEMFFCPIYYVSYQEGDENIYLGIEQTTGIEENKQNLIKNLIKLH